MTFRDASKLHNGDEVISTENEESVKVLSIKVFPGGGKGRKGTISIVEIEGVGTKSGYGTWYHDTVR